MGGSSRGPGELFLRGWAEWTGLRGMDGGADREDGSNVGRPEGSGIERDRDDRKGAADEVGDWVGG